jgi:hypothetical protein
MIDLSEKVDRCPGCEIELDPGNLSLGKLSPHLPVQK